ncbi:hypothetical protein UFOVP955_13 [uncultured Caudovirales phage]|uniref:Uncharacterized protein n=1 Tax=uncultured Caudovirales phage TaxID=2100421 RepID=A0A6J5Q1L6_9CAUD|nr:hypothetical protein UFOVP955_13 [uncultured Caudovirales phage]
MIGLSLDDDAVEQALHVITLDIARVQREKASASEPVFDLTRKRDAEVTRCTCGSWRLVFRPCVVCAVMAERTTA